MLRSLALTPPDEFVAARNLLAKQLKADGDNDTAKQVAALRRGSWADWALNAVADDDPALVERYLTAAESVGEMQSSGEGDLRSALRELRDLSNKMIRAASAQMTRHRHTPDLLDLVERLAEVGNSPEASERLRVATLTAEVGAAPDGAESDDEIFTPSSKPRRATKPAAAKSAPEPEPEPVDELRRKRLQRAVDDAQQTLDEATGDLEHADQELAAAIAAVEEATAAVERANAELSDARRQQIDAKRRRQSAHQNVVASNTALDRATAAFDKADR